MFRLTFKVPKTVAIAVSGGVDSMAAVDFLRKSRDITVLHYNHGTGAYADKAENLVRKYCSENKIKCAIGYNEEDLPKGVSAEAWWRDKRYSWFEEVVDIPIIMAHHLDDVAETWLFTSLHGRPQLIPSQRGKYWRPFLTTRKKVFEEWCQKRGVPHVEDPSNKDNVFMRNYIRNVMMPNALQVNPGFHKVLKKKLLSNESFS